MNTFYSVDGTDDDKCRCRCDDYNERGDDFADMTREELEERYLFELDNARRARSEAEQLDEEREYWARLADERQGEIDDLNRRVEELEEQLEELEGY